MLGGIVGQPGSHKALLQVKDGISTASHDLAQRTAVPFLAEDKIDGLPQHFLLVNKRHEGVGPGRPVKGLHGIDQHQVDGKNNKLFVGRGPTSSQSQGGEEDDAPGKLSPPVA